MESTNQEQTGLLPLDQQTHLPLKESAYLELYPSIYDGEGAIGDAATILLIHSPYDPRYLETVKHICNSIEVVLDETKKDVIAASILYMAMHEQLEPENYNNLLTFLNEDLRLDVKKFPLSKIKMHLVAFTAFKQSAHIINKVLTKQDISKEDIDNFLIQKIEIKGAKIQPEIKKHLKTLCFSQIVRFFTEVADDDAFSSFEKSLQGHLSLVQPNISLRIQLRFFCNFLAKEDLKECDRLIPEIQELIQRVKDQIDPEAQNNINSEERSCLSEAFYRIADYYWVNYKPRLALESLLEAIQIYPLDAFRHPERVILNIDIFKKDEVKNFWLDRIVQAWPLPDEVKPELLRWILKGYDVMRSQEPLLLDEYEEQKLLLQRKIGIKEINNAMDQVELYRKIIFYAYNHNIDETCNLLLILDQNKYIFQALKYVTKVRSLYFLSQNGNERVAELMDTIHLRTNDANSYMNAADIYLNLYDHLKKSEYLEKASLYLQRTNKMFADVMNKNYIKMNLRNLNLVFAIKFLQLCEDYEEDRQKVNEYFEKSSIYLSKVNELSIDMIDQDSVKEHLIKVNSVMVVMALKFDKPYEKYMDFLYTLGVELDLGRLSLDYKLDENYKALRIEAHELQEKEILGEPEVVYSWIINGQEVVKSTDPDVILTDPDQLIFGRNGLKGTKHKLKSLDEGLRKGFMPPNKQGKGLKYLADLGIIEVKDNSGRRLATDRVFINPEGAKLMNMSMYLNHLGIKRQEEKREKLAYVPCGSETCSTMPDIEKYKIQWQKVCGFMSGSKVFSTGVVPEGAGGGRGL